MLDGIKYIFQIPMEWFLRVERFITGFYSGTGIELRRDYNGQTCVGLDKDQAVRLLGVPSREQGTAETITDPNADDGDEPSYAASWTAGGQNGLTLDVYAACEKDSGYHYLYRATIEISKDGLIKSVTRHKGYKEITA